MLPFDSTIALKLLAAFFIGSIPFAIIAMMGTGIDIRQVGSGNPGFNNVLRVNKTRAILTLIGDMGKGFVAVWLLQVPGEPQAFAWVYGFMAVFGHCYSPFLKFNGGKGIATSAGVMLILYPAWAALAIGFFVLVRLTGSRLHWKEAGMIASISTWMFFAVLMFILIGDIAGRNALLMTVFLAWRHQQNFRNLFAA